MWKATEFRDFLLYTGPLVLKGVLPSATYKHFMALTTAIRILSSASFLKYNVAVKHFRTIYGVNQMTYNVHGLLHLASDSAKFGPLDKFSAFKFESHLGKLKRKLRTAYKTLPQICNRIAEMRSIAAQQIVSKPSTQVSFSMDVKNTNHFLQATFPSFIIVAGKQGDDCVHLTSQKTVRITHFLGETKFVGELVSNECEFYD